MRRARQLLHALYRHGYYVAMYSGLRALVNLARSRRGQLDARLASLHRAHVDDPELGRLRLHVHGRPQLHPDGQPASHAMLSLQRRPPTTGRWRYRAACATSHFGCGHVEVALFERRGTVTFYAIRNIASANARRIGLTGAAARLRLADCDEEPRVLHMLARLLTERGLAVQHAATDDCLRLAIDERLIPPGRRAQTLRALRRRYERLRRTLAC